jgi:uncharacterized protein
VLTSDQLRVRRSGEKLTARFLKPADQKRLLPTASDLVTVLSGAVGERRQEVQERLGAVAFGTRDRVVVLGLQKLLLDRCDFSVDDGAAPDVIRRELFLRAAKARAALGPTEPFDRDAVIAETAGALECPVDTIEGRLFADLRNNEVLRSFRKLDAEALLARYDVALAQGVLLRATRIQVALDKEAPGRVRQLFRAARFHGLMHRVERVGKDGWLIELDGPMSLFSAMQKYGLKLAVFLPAVLRCKRWRLRAQILWGKKKDRCVFELGPDAGLIPSDRRITGVAQELSSFVDAFSKLNSAWTVKANEEIVALPGEAVCVPDLVFSNDATGEEVFLEAFGFWSRQAVWQRIEMLQRADFPSRIILAVGKQLRVSQELLEGDEAAELYVYKTKMSPKKVLGLLDSRG